METSFGLGCGLSSGHHTRRRKYTESLGTVGLEMFPFYIISVYKVFMGVCLITRCIRIYKIYRVLITNIVWPLVIKQTPLHPYIHL